MQQWVFRSIVFFLIVSALKAQPVQKKSSLNSSKPLSTRVLIVSIDGGKPSVLRSAKMPTLKRLVHEGAFSWEAQTINPSLTLPSHVSMLTGVEPRIHGIFWNDWDKKAKPLKTPTIFSLSTQAGLSTALFAAKEKFQHLNLPGSIQHFSATSDWSTSMAHLAVAYLKAHDVQLCFIHLPDADFIGHRNGWGSREQKEALEDVDKALKIIMEHVNSVKTTQPYTVILTADHGGREKNHGSTHPEDMTIPWIVWGPGVKRGHIDEDIQTTDTAATALQLLGVPIPKHMSGRFISSAFSR